MCGADKEDSSQLRRGEVDDPVEVDSVDNVHEVEDEEAIAAPAEEDAERFQRLPTPDTPTRSDMLDHRAHVPLRAWRPDCVEGRGQSSWHLCQPCEGRSTPTVSFGYCLIGDK